MIDGLSDTQSALKRRTGVQNAADTAGPAYAAFEKAEALVRTVASVVTESQPAKTEGHTGRNINIVT